MINANRGQSMPPSLVPDERHQDQRTQGDGEPGPWRGDADDPHEREAAGHQQQAGAQEQESGTVEAAGLALVRVGHEADDDEHDHHGQDPGHDQHHPQRVEQRRGRTGRERSGDRTGLERGHDDARRPPGGGGPLGQARAASVDQRHLERQPHGEDALQRPEHEVALERGGEGDAARGDRREHGRPDQHPLVADEITELGQRRHAQRREEQLRRLEPVDVGVVDVEVTRDVGGQRRVVALEESADELHEDERADESGPDGGSAMSSHAPQARPSAGVRTVDRPVSPPRPRAGRG